MKVQFFKERYGCWEPFYSCEVSILPRIGEKVDVDGGPIYTVDDIIHRLKEDTVQIYVTW